jgi:indole-3-glycerol phosphate synthase
MNILDEIFAHKIDEIAACKLTRPLAEVRAEAEATPQAADFLFALRTSHSIPALIAEVKFASPSKGVLVADPDPLELARTYAENGAAAISVLTDEKYFHGKLEYLSAIHADLPTIPLLRKDFTCDAYQVYEARAAGASAVLLIAAYLDAGQLAEFHALALSLGLTPLVEVHKRSELDRALRLDGLRLLGVNNRDLRTFRVDLQTCLDLRRLVPDDVCFVAESGIHTPADVARLREAGVDAMLIGEALVKAEDVGGKVRQLLNTE